MQIVSSTKIEQVREAIVRQILSGELTAGQRLLEAKLARELNVSQATVNGALQDLHKQGLVNKLQNRSTNVCRYQQADLENLFEVRMVLEPLAVEAVSRRWSEDILAQLREKVDNMRRAARMKDVAKFSIADYAFHQEIYKRTGNAHLTTACEAISAGPLAFILCDGLRALPTDYLALAEDHQDIVLAMQDGPAIANRVVRERLLEWRQHSLRVFAGSEPLSNSDSHQKGGSVRAISRSMPETRVPEGT